MAKKAGVSNDDITLDPERQRARQGFADRLQEWRMRTSRTQEAAAEYLRVSRRTYEGWERADHIPGQVGPILSLIETELVERRAQKALAVRHRQGRSNRVT